MIDIFSFIFSCLKDVFNFLDFSLPGIGLTFVEFFLLALIIPLIFRLVRGAITESGNDVLFGVMDSAGSISSSYATQYHNFLKYKNSKQLVFSTRRDDYTIRSGSITRIPTKAERIQMNKKARRDRKIMERSISQFK